MIRATMLVGTLATASGLVIGAPKMQSSRVSTPMMANIADTLATIEGPDLYWEEKGPLQNPPKEESDFKEYDTFSTFLGACSSFGVDLTASDITVFAPANKACAEYIATYGPLTKPICEYHIVKGIVNSDSLGSSPLTTA